MSEIDFDSIEEGTVLLVVLDGNTDSKLEVTVDRVFTILTGDLEEVNVYMVYESVDDEYKFPVGDGEIVEVVEEDEDAGE